MVKKILAAVLAAMLCLSLAACGEDDAYSLYVKMNKAMQEAKSVELKGTADITMDFMGQEMDMTMEIDIKEVIRSETDVDMEMVMTIGMMGESATSIAYYKDGYMYQDVDGEKFKMSMDMEDMMAQMNVGQINIVEDAIESAEVEKNGDDKVLTIVLKKEFANEVLGSMVDTILDMIGVSGMEVSFSDITYISTADKKNMLKDYRMIYSIEMDMMGMVIGASYDTYVEVVSVNSVDAINFPDDLDSYPEQ